MRSFVADRSCVGFQITIDARRICINLLCLLRACFDVDQGTCRFGIQEVDEVNQTILNCYQSRLLLAISCEYFDIARQGYKHCANDGSVSDLTQNSA